MKIYLPAIIRATLIPLVIVALSVPVCAQTSYSPSAENQAAREWFQQARFGLFIHWGIYSVLGDGEWVMNNQNIPVDDYEKLATFFNPTQFNAEEWVLMAKNAGMQYITITSRHHDGFSMFATQASDYNIVDRTPYKQDVLKQLADACQKHDIKLFFYYSLLDWNRDDYFPRGRTGSGIKGREEGEWEDYIDFMKTQLTELLTNYGPVAGIWFDGHWDQLAWDGKRFGNSQVDWHYDELYALIHELQPQALIGNNHHLAPIAGEDFQMFERDLPGHNTTGWGTSLDDVGALPFEMCETINGAWGFNLQDDKHKSSQELVHLLVKAAGFNSNLLLNVGPMPNGKIQPEHVAALAEVGEWLKENGNTIYGTTAGPVEPRDWGVSTQKGKKVYLHILDWQEDALLINNFAPDVKKVSFYDDKTAVEYDMEDYGLVISLPEDKRDKVDTIIEITLK
jgi:alpha-L-fucosidase